MSAPRVSVVLPTYNRVDLLARSAGSVLHQRFRDLELIVVDDGSSEDIASALARFADPRIRYVRRDRRGGVAAARNTGVREARGDWLAFQDSDDEWLLDKLGRQLAFAEQHHAELCVGGLLRHDGARVRFYPDRAALPRERLDLEGAMRHPWAYTQTWLVRRAVVLATGGFDEGLRVWEDWDLLLQLVARQPAWVLREPLVVSEQRADGLSVVAPDWVGALDRIVHKHSGLLAHQRRGRAGMRYTMARLHAARGNAPAARAWAWRSLGDVAWRWRPWVLLALTFLGSSALRAIIARREAGTR